MEKKRNLFRREVNATTILIMSSHEVQANIFPLLKVPEVSPNHPTDVEGELTPLLAAIANEASHLAHMQAICVSTKSELEAGGIGRSDGDYRETKAKIDILDRAIKQSNRNWDAVSRILTVIMERPHSRLRKAGS